MDDNTVLTDGERSVIKKRNDREQHQEVF